MVPRTVEPHATQRSGKIESVIKSYGPLMDYMTANGLKCVEGWREWYLYWESDNSTNNISWVQHVAQEA
jgi:hypothetical protein